MKTKKKEVERGEEFKGIELKKLICNITEMFLLSDRNLYTSIVKHFSIIVKQQLIERSTFLYTKINKSFFLNCYLKS